MQVIVASSPEKSDHFGQTWKILEDTSFSPPKQRHSPGFNLRTHLKNVEPNNSLCSVQ